MAQDDDKKHGMNQPKPGQPKPDMSKKDDKGPAVDPMSTPPDPPAAEPEKK